MTPCDLTLLIDLTPPDLLGTIRRAEKYTGITAALLNSRPLAGVKADFHNQRQYAAIAKLAEAKDRARASLIGFD